VGMILLNLPSHLKLLVLLLLALTEKGVNFKIRFDCIFLALFGLKNDSWMARSKRMFELFFRLAVGGLRHLHFVAAWTWVVAAGNIGMPVLPVHNGNVLKIILSILFVLDLIRPRS
jgi:hypothetical protein